MLHDIRKTLVMDLHPFLSRRRHSFIQLHCVLACCWSSFCVVNCSWLNICAGAWVWGSVGEPGTHGTSWRHDGSRTPLWAAPRNHGQGCHAVPQGGKPERNCNNNKKKKYVYGVPTLYKSTFIFIIIIVVVAIFVAFIAIIIIRHQISHCDGVMYR